MSSNNNLQFNYFYKIFNNKNKRNQNNKKS